MNRYKIIFCSFVIASCLSIIWSNIGNEKYAEVYLEKSVPLIGADVTRKLGFEGKGVKIGVIDTGIDYTHPDLLGLGPDGKVIGGYDYVDNDEEPMDTNGHGTEVAGIIAADGNLKGVAPKGKLLAYRVSATGDSVSSDFIVKAIHRAIQDKVDIINISLGVNKTNNEIDKAVEEAIRNGVIVVAAAGNNGPGIHTIGSPAKSIDAITVGASYNNITASLVSTLSVGKKQYEVLPMLGTKALSEPISAKIVFGGFGRIVDLDNVDAKGSILLVERGSNVKGEKIYFSEKEYNAAQSGAKAIIVYNNEQGIFLGDLFHADASPDYSPRIPALSMSRDDGLALRQSLVSSDVPNLNVFYHPDFVTPFSSRGPVSPFYIKPDLVAPGVFVNSTMIRGKYNLTSGTSFAAPHVSGAVAILLEKNPDLLPSEVSSILSTTAEPVSDPYGSIFPVEIAGSGRINLARAFSADLIILPHNLVFNLSLQNPTQTKQIHMKSLGGKVPSLEIESTSEENGIRFEHVLQNDTLYLKVFSTAKKPGEFERTLLLNDGETNYRIPILIHLTKGAVKTVEKNGMLSVGLDYPDEWSYAKISVTNKETDETVITSITPQKNSSIAVYESGEYWIDAQISTKNGTDHAYRSSVVQNPAAKTGLVFLHSFGIPLKQLLIILVILVATLAIGLKTRRR